MIIFGFSGALIGKLIVLVNFALLGLMRDVNVSMTCVGIVDGSV